MTPPNPLSTTKVDILSFVSPVLGSVTGVWAKTVNTSAIPPLLILWTREGEGEGKEEEEEGNKVR